MPETSAGTEASASESSSGNVTNQLAILVPSLDPGKDDLQVYQQKVALLLEAWPVGKYTELATRLILNCTGSAFKKLQLHQSELIANDRKSIHRIVELLGGHWGQIDLEQRYEFAERALYRCSRKSDESADSYLARADIIWTELNSKKFQLSDLQAYVTLRGSVVSPEDKTRVLVDADVADKGELTVKRVSSAIRMLGAGFFQEMTSGKRLGKQKTYDQAAFTAEDLEESDLDQYAMIADNTEEDDQMVEALVQEGDEDATLVMDFEAAATELLQNDDDLSAAYTPYTDARRRLNEKVRSRGFWPISAKGKPKGPFKGVKGKFSKGHGSSRKSLRQRILESRCRLCNQVGHWKAECPSRRDASGPSTMQGTTQAPTSFAQVDPSAVGVKDALPVEFLNLPMQQETALDEIQHEVGVEQVFMTINIDDSKIRFRKSLHQWEISSNQIIPPARNSHDDQAVRLRLRSRVHACQPGIADDEPKACDSSEVLVRKQVTRCPCVVTFRFGNHGVLRSQQALVVPIPGTPAENRSSARKYTVSPFKHLAACHRSNC